MTKPNKDLSIKILKIVGVVTLVLVVSTIAAPQLPYFILRAYLKHKFGTKYTNDQIYNSLRYLKRKKFIAFEFKESKLKIFLTHYGRKHLETINIHEIKIPPTKWDGRWRLLTFDIPESKNAARHFFRKKLKQLGFFHFQRSVFILPFGCEEEISQITKFLQIRPYVHLITCDRFPNDASLVKKFKL